MDEPFRLRRYDPADADRVWTVHERALRAAPVPFVEDAPADAALTDISGEYLDAGGEFLVGLVEGTIVAVGGFQPPDAGTAELRHLRVHPSHQRRGYGERLLAALETRAAERGIDRLVLWTNDRLEAAQELYETHGYTTTGRETHPETGDVFVRYRKGLQAVEGQIRSADDLPERSQQGDRGTGPG